MLLGELGERLVEGALELVPRGHDRGVVLLLRAERTVARDGDGARRMQRGRVVVRQVVLVNDAVPRVARPRGGHVVLETDGASHLLPPLQIDRPVDRDLAEPGQHARTPLEQLERPVRFQERLLRHVESVLDVARDPEGHLEDRRAVLRVELLERLRVSPERAGDPIRILGARVVRGLGHGYPLFRLTLG